MNQFDLNGEWTVRQDGDAERLLARVPGCIHLDLLSAGKIEDPFFRDNEKTVAWVAENDWIYEREFFVTEDLLREEHVRLSCAGLDTLATLYINDVKAGS